MKGLFEIVCDGEQSLLGYIQSIERMSGTDTEEVRNLILMSAPLKVNLEATISLFYFTPYSDVIL